MSVHAGRRLRVIGFSAVAWLCGAVEARAQAASLSGSIAYPGEEVPAMQIAARSTADGALTIIRTVAGQQRYSMRVSPGTYVVFAVPIGGDGDGVLRGAHTTYSLCARDLRQRNAGRCRTGALVDLSVAGAATLSNIDIDDWYLHPDLAATLQIDGEEPDAELAFSAYPATSSAPSKPAAPNFRSAPPAAQRLKREIERGVAGGPVFAGRVAVARWTCGARCERWALIDLRTGRILMPETPYQTAQLQVPCQAPPLEYRADSRLLRVHRVDGPRVVTQHLLWSAGARRLKPLAESVVSVEEFCRRRPAPVQP